MKALIFLRRYQKIFLHIAALAPGVYLLFRYLTGQLTADPVQDVTLHTGKYALVFLMLSLSMTPLKTVSGWSWTANARKWFGLYAFFYALIHLLVFIGWDYGFAWQFIWPEILQKRYLIVGLSAFTILFLLAGTSFRWWTDRLGRGWTWLHRLVYAAGVLVILHFAWVKKGDIFTLKGDVIEPFIYGVIFLLLMLLRIPAIRRKMSTGRRRHRRKQQSTTGTVVVRRMKHTDQGVQGE